MPTLSFIVDNQNIVACTPVEQARLYIKDGSNDYEIILQEELGNISFPVQLKINPITQKKIDSAAGIVVLPMTGGGRGPIINYGETITTSLLLELLQSAISSELFRPELVALLDNIPRPVPNSRVQRGYATHNDTIILNHDWSGRPPKIEISLSHGQIVKKTEKLATDIIGVDYVEIPDQEIIYGHSGLVNNHEFTVKAAILEKSAPVIIPLDWAPTEIVGPPVSVETEHSVETSTTYPCMGLRIQGMLGLTNTTAYDVAGTIYAQISVDSGPWINIAELYWFFEADDYEFISEKFDEIMTYDQSHHSYQFRGLLVIDSDEEPNRRLTGSITIDTVAEMGAGNIVSNDLQLKWTCKE